MLRMHQSLGAVATVVLTLACSAQVEPGYSGESSATIHGTLSTGTKEVPRYVEVAAILLQRDAKSEFMWTAAQASVDMQFPAEFKLKFYDPPEAAVLNKEFTLTGLVALLPANSGESIDPNSILGGATNFMFYYFPRDGNPNDPEDRITMDAQAYGFAPTKGYHFLRMEVIEERESQAFKCKAAGLCERLVLENREDPLALDPNTLTNQRFIDEDFARCQKYVPEAGTCTSYVLPVTPEEEAENTRCRELRWSLLDQPNRDVSCSDGGAILLPIPQGTSPSITIAVGATLPDLMMPRLPL